MYLKLSKMLEQLAFKLRQKSLYYELKHYIKIKENYIKKMHPWQRGIGKTYTLIQLADKYHCPIIVPLEMNKKYILSKAKNMRKSIKVYKLNAINYSSYRSLRSDIVLIDEGVDNDLIEYYLVPTCKQIIGFSIQP